MTFGAKVLATLRALGLFVGVWGILGLVAWIGGVVPSSATGAVPEDNDTQAISGDPSAAATSDDEEELPAAEEEAMPAPTEVVPVAPAAASPASPMASGDVTRVCPNPLSPVSTVVGQLVGDDAPELVVTCGADVLILGRSGEGIMRVGDIRDASSTPAQGARAAIGDLDGDGLHDLLVGFVGAPEHASASRLIVVPGNERGGLDAPKVLAPISARDISVAELDGRPGADVVALHQADGFGRRPSEAWVIAGGPSPVRTHRQILGSGAHALALADLDGDQHIDILSAESQGLRAYPGDGAGRLGRVRDVSERDSAHVLAVATATPPLVASIAGEQLSVRQGDDAPVRSLDLDAEVKGLGRLTTSDGQEELLVLYADAWARVAMREHLEEVQRTPLPAGIDALAIARWGDEVVVLGRSESGVELIRLPVEGGEVDETADPTSLPDAPLVLRVEAR